MSGFYPDNKRPHDGAFFLDYANSHVQGMVLCLPMFEASKTDTLDTGKIVNILEHTRDTVFQTLAGGGGNPGFDYGGFMSNAPTGIYVVPFPDSWLTGAATGQWRTFGDMTFMIRFYKIAHDVNACVYSSDTYGNDSEGTGNRNIMLIRSDDATPARGFFLQIQGTTVINYLPNPAWQPATTYTLTFTRRGSDCRLYQDGEQVASGTSSTTFKAHRPGLFAQRQSGSWITNSVSSIHYLYMWERGMEHDEILEIESNPWGMFEKPSRAKYFDVPAAASAVIPPQVYTMNVHSL